MARYRLGPRPEGEGVFRFEPQHRRGIRNRFFGAAKPAVRLRARSQRDGILGLHGESARRGVHGPLEVLEKTEGLGPHLEGAHVARVTLQHGIGSRDGILETPRRERILGLGERAFPGR